MPDAEQRGDLTQRYYRIHGYLGLDLSDLDHAFMTTSPMLQEAGELVADADLEENRAKHALDVARAEASERIRSELPNPTEARIALLLASDLDVREARSAHEKAMHVAALCTALHRSMDVQSRLLAKAADMVVSGYITPASIHDSRRAEIRRARVEAARAEELLQPPRITRPTRQE